MRNLSTPPATETRQDVHLVIRSAGERTATVAARLAGLCGMAADDIVVVREVPFEQALRASYQEGIRAGRTWTMTLDADVLLNANAIAALIHCADQLPSQFLQLEGCVFDKITGSYRQAGHRIYRTELLPLALTQIPPPSTRVRPERFTLGKMIALGYPSRCVPEVVGLHDFEQHYADLYRKSLVHAKKHPYLLDDLLLRCARQMHEDTDFLIILKGLWDGLRMPGMASIDVRRYEDQARRAMQSMGLTEKAPIADSDDSLRALTRLCDAVTSTDAVPQFVAFDKPPNPEDTPRAPQASGVSWIGKTRRRITQHGLLRGGLASIGALLRLAGQRLDA